MEETEEQEIVGYFIDEVNCDIFCKDCVKSREKKIAEELGNIITKKYKPDEGFLRCDRCGKIL